MEVEELLKDFEETAIQQFEVQDTGNYKKSDRLLEKINKISKKLHGIGEIDTLKILLNHSHVNVRFLAACSLLPFFTKESEKVLEEIACLGKHPAFTAKMTLQEWRKGNIKFNY